MHCNLQNKRNPGTSTSGQYGIAWTKFTSHMKWLRKHTLSETMLLDIGYQVSQKSDLWERERNEVKLQLPEECLQATLQEGDARQSQMVSLSWGNGSASLRRDWESSGQSFQGTTAEKKQLQRSEEHSIFLKSPMEYC